MAIREHVKAEVARGNKPAIAPYKVRITTVPAGNKIQLKIMTDASERGFPITVSLSLDESFKLQSAIVAEIVRVAKSLENKLKIK